MARSVAIIGAGQIGYTAARAFLWEGWEVQLHARTAPPWLTSDMAFHPYVLGEQSAPHADCVLDTIAYDEGDIARYNPDAVGHVIAVSSASVYVDDQSRSLEKSGITGFPEFHGLINEGQATVAPGPESYSTRKMRMEHKARALFGDRSTILRPCAIYGPWSRHAREWWFVNRIKDRRSMIPLAFEGESVFHTTSAASIGALAVHLADSGLGGVYNIADDDAPSVREIGKAIIDQFGKRIRLYQMEGPPEGAVGRTPWSIPLPFELDTTKAYDSGFDGFGIYSIDVGETIDWLRGIESEAWREHLPQLAAYPFDLFDYTAEDRFFAGQA